LTIFILTNNLFDSLMLAYKIVAAIKPSNNLECRLKNE